MRIIVLSLILLVMMGCSDAKLKMFAKFKGGTPEITSETVVIPFNIEASHLMKVAVSLNEESHQFVLDTGGITMLDRSLADSLNLELTQTPRMGVRFGEVATISTGKASVRNLNANVLDFSNTFRMGRFGFEGMLGSDYLRFFRTTIDYQNSQILLDDLKKPFQVPSNASSMKMNIILPCLPTVKTVINDNLELKGMIDTGVQFAFVMPYESLTKLPPEQQEKAVQARGSFAKWPYTSQNRNTLVRVAKIEVGEIVVENVDVLFADLPSMLDEDIMLLGKYFLEDYRTVLDYKNKRVTLIPSGIRTKPILLESGLALVKSDGEVLVTGIWEHSPADKSGFLIGDKVISINGKDCRTMSSHAVSNFMPAETDKRITFVIERDGKTIKLSL
jgi:predicted aspartyl protease